MSRAASTQVSCQLVAEHRLDEDEAVDLAHDLTVGLVRKAYAVVVQDLRKQLFTAEFSILPTLLLSRLTKICEDFQIGAGGFGDRLRDGPRRWPQG